MVMPLQPEQNPSQPTTAKRSSASRVNLASINQGVSGEPIRLENPSGSDAPSFTNIPALSAPSASPDGGIAQTLGNNLAIPDGLPSAQRQRQQPRDVPLGSQSLVSNEAPAGNGERQVPRTLGGSSAFMNSAPIPNNSRLRSRALVNEQANLAAQNNQPVNLNSGQSSFMQYLASLFGD